MKIGIMQPYFFPYIGYWQLLNAVDKYIIYDDVNYIKGGWINRNRILLNNMPHYFNLTMKDASPFKLINEIGVSNNEILQRKMLKTLEQAYKKSPFYEQSIKVLEKIIYNTETNLAKYLVFQMKEICNYLEIKTQLIVSSEIEKDNSLKSEEKVINICKTLDATEYYNAIGGQELYSFENFKNHSIDLKFLKSDNITYNQYDNEFVPALSIIDIMMFNDVPTIRKMLCEYKIINNDTQISE